MMRNILDKLAICIIIIFSLFGAVVLSIVLHEYSHASDFKGIVNNSEICGLVLPQSLDNILSSDGGFYSFSYNKENADNLQPIERYTEYKAYSITFLVLLVFFMSLSVILNRFSLSSLT